VYKEPAMTLFSFLLPYFRTRPDVQSKTWCNFCDNKSIGQDMLGEDGAMFIESMYISTYKIFNGLILQSEAFLKFAG